LVILVVFVYNVNGLLPELERNLETLEIDEHPTWEDFIEWRNGIEQLEHFQLTETIEDVIVCQINILGR
jgi:hypothetical protein